MALVGLGVADVADDALVAAAALEADQIKQLAVVLAALLASGVLELLCHHAYAINFIIYANPFPLSPYQLKSAQIFKSYLLLSLYLQNSTNPICRSACTFKIAQILSAAQLVPSK